MAHRTRAQIAATKRMQAGLRSWKKKQRRANPKKRKARARRANTFSYANPVTYSNPVAYVVNPGRPSTMAKKKRRSKKHRDNKPGKKRRRANPPNPKHRRRRRRNTFTYSNPVTLAATGFRKVAGLTIPALAGSFVVNFAESKFYPNLHPVIRGLIKTGVAVGAAGMLRGSPEAAAATVGAIIGTLGGELGTRAGGGLVALSAKQGMKELSQMVADDGDLALVMREELKGFGLGLVLREDLGQDEDMGEEGIDQTDEASIDADDEEAA